jgi:hypothetical protein
MKAMTTSRVIEVTSAYAYLGLARREVFAQYRSGQAFWFFSRERSGDTLEVWAFGVYVVIDRRLV